MTLITLNNLPFRSSLFFRQPGDCQHCSSLQWLWITEQHDQEYILKLEPRNLSLMLLFLLRRRK